jgi:hypothetical protein
MGVANIEADSGYAYGFTESGRSSRDELPPWAREALLGVLDELAADPQNPARTQVLGKSLLIYKHDYPLLEVTYEIDEARRALILHHLVAPLRGRWVFISYCHKDRGWLNRLKLHLKKLEERRLIESWDDTKIQKGRLWREEIEKQLARANVAVLLVTDNFWNSAFISENELPPLLEKARSGGCSVLWLAVSGKKQSELDSYQAVNDPERPLDGLPEREQKRIFTALRKTLEDAVIPKG